MKYRIIELQKEGGLKSYRVETKWLCFWLRLRGDPRGKHGDIPGPILWFNSAAEADFWVWTKILKPKCRHSRVVKEVTVL